MAKIVEYRHGMSTFEQKSNDSSADIPSTTGYQNVQRIRSFLK